MNLDPAQHHFADYQFFPWAGFFVLGALRTFEVSNAETRRSLVRQVRAYHLATFILVAITVPVGISLNLVLSCLVVGRGEHHPADCRLRHRHSSMRAAARPDSTTT